MYRIVKRIVRTITTVTWVVRWENRAGGEGPVEEQIALSPSYSLTEEEVSEAGDILQEVRQVIDPGFDRNLIHKPERKDENE